MHCVIAKREDQKGGINTSSGSERSGFFSLKHSGGKSPGLNLNMLSLSLHPMVFTLPGCLHSTGSGVRELQDEVTACEKAESLIRPLV